MKKVKRFLIWLTVLLISFGFVAYQNKEFLFEKEHIGLDFYFDFAKFQTPDLPIAVFFVILFFAGLLIAYFASLSEKYVDRKNIRRLTDEVDMARKKVSELETKLASAQATHVANNSALSSGPADVPEL